MGGDGGGDAQPDGDDAPLDGDAGASSSRRRPRKLSPTQRALGLLTRREHSRRELVRKLEAKGIASDEVEAVVAKLERAGWQSDVRFAESRVRVRVGDGYGPQYIRAELATHGLGRDTIAAAIDTFEGDWAANARDLVRRRYGDAVVDDLKLRRKAADVLMRRGFDAACIQSATRFDPDG